MADMIATKSFVYATRRLRPGQDFITKSERDARILASIGKAVRKRVPGKIAPPPAGLATKIGRSQLEYPVHPKAQIKKVPEITALRAEYQAVTGKRAFHGWDAAVLRAKIAEARLS